jgi:adenylate cyclase
LTESFINSLSRVSGLKVIARNTVFRYKNKDIEAKEVGETLGVTAILSGRIRVIKDNLMISVELIKVADGTQLWGTQFNQPFSDIIKIQEKITLEVSEKLKSEINNVTKNSLTNPVTNNAESYRLYLKGKYLLEKWTEESIYKAIDCFDKSVFYDPTNVHSYAETVECYCALYTSDYILYSDVLIKIKPYLSAISKLNQSVDVVQEMYGKIKMFFEWRFEEAEKHYQNALTINPYYLNALYRYTDFLIDLGRFPEALNLLNKIMITDPLSLPNYKRIGRLFYKMGRLENAVRYVNEALEINSTDYIALVILGAALTELGKYKEALSVFQKSLNLQYNIDTLSMIGYVNAREGKKDEAFQVIEQIKSQSKNNCNYSIKIAIIFLALGEKEITYNLLEQAFEEHDEDLIALKSDPRLKTINNEPRFKEFALRIGLPIS